MALLRERVRRLEDASIKVPQDGINIARAELIRDMIQTGRRCEDLMPQEREVYDDYASLAKPLFDFTAADLLAKIRGLPDAEQAPEDAIEPVSEPIDDEPIESY